MNVLVIGSGGREHALSWMISKSKLLNKLFIAPGNAGTHAIGENCDTDPMDFESIGKLAIDKKINLVVIGPEQPLVAGMADYFQASPHLKDIPVIGPFSAGAMLEGSKDFAKSFMTKYNIPTAKYQTFTEGQYEAAVQFLQSLTPPYVLKADGLAGGKGVVIPNTLGEAKEELRNLYSGKFGEAGKKIVIEEYLDGIECSVFILTDGNSYKIFPEAKDYKRAGEKDTGLNTGGMGAVSPVSFADNTFLSNVEKKVIIPTIEGLKKENIKYCGFLYFGLMKVGNEPYVIEYNVRMGDPEAEVVLPRIKNDLLELFVAVAEGKLAEKKLLIDPAYAITVIMASGGYPGSYEKGKNISGLDKVNESVVFHAGTKKTGSDVVTNGGRVLAVTSFGKNMNDALKKSYKNTEIINFAHKQYRKDIGFDL